MKNEKIPWRNLCFLGSMDLSIDQIALILSEENAKEVSFYALGRESYSRRMF